MEHILNMCSISPAQLNVYPGLKGLKELLGSVPAWIHYEERERVEVRADLCHDCWSGFCASACVTVVRRAAQLPSHHVQAVMKARDQTVTQKNAVKVLHVLRKLTKKSVCRNIVRGCWESKLLMGRMACRWDFI